MLFEMLHRAVPYQGWDQSKSHEPLKLIAEFRFGDTYDIEFNSGVTVEMRNLDRLIEAVDYEFKHSNMFCPSLSLLPRWRKSTILRIVPFVPNGNGFATDGLGDTLSLLVTTFNISGEWDEATLSAYTRRHNPKRGEYANAV